MHLSRRTIMSAAALALIAFPAAAAEVVNVYNSRHYGTDQQLWDEFTKATGIEVNVVDGTHEQLIQRMQSEGANSPADVFITVDAGRLAARHAGAWIGRGRWQLFPRQEARRLNCYRARNGALRAGRSSPGR